MSSSWLPQNIQKRIFRYILQRLQVFSNLDLSNLDVSVGTKPSLKLRDVELDSEKFHLPNGVFIRNGKLGRLNLEVKMGGGGGRVEIDGSDLEFTVALSSSSLDEEDLSDLLSRTTADLAESLLIDRKEVEGEEEREKGRRGRKVKDDLEEKGKKSDSDSDSDSADSNIGIGYGFGDLNIVNRVAEVALSQISLKLNNVVLKLIIDEELGLDIVVEKVELVTEGGIRRLKVYNVEILTKGDDEDKEEDIDHEHEHEHEHDHDDHDNHIDDTHNLYQSSFQHHDMQNSLMQSTVFSHEQASTMYMSAMSVIQDRPEIRLLRLLWCDHVEFSFKGLLKSDFKIDIGVVKVSARPLPNVLKAVINFVHEFEENTMKSREKEVYNEGDKTKGNEKEKGTKNDNDNDNDEGDHDDKQSISLLASLKQFYLTTGKVLPNGEFECDLITLEISNVNMNISNKTQLLSISDILLTKSDKKLFSFLKKNQEEDTLIYHLGENNTILLPHRAFIDIHFDDIIDIKKVIEPFLNLTLPTATTIISTKSSASKPTPKPPPISAKLNAIQGIINTGSTSIDFTIYPSTFENTKLNVNTIRININSTIVDNGSITINNLKLLTDSNLSTKLKSIDSEDISTKILNRLEISTINVNLNQQLIDLLIKDFKTLTAFINNTTIITTTPIIPITNTTPKHVRIEEQFISLSIHISKIDCEFTFKKSTPLGTFNIDFGNIEYNLIKSASHLSITTLFISRDFSDLDSTQSHISLIYNANASDKSHPMIYVELNKDVIDISLYNIGIYYHTRLLELFDNTNVIELHEDEPKLDDSIATIKDDSMKISMFLNNCVVELNPLGFPSRALYIIKDSINDFTISHNEIILDIGIKRSSLLLVDNIAKLESGVSRDISNYYLSQGYVSIASISSLQMAVKQSEKQKPLVDVRVDSVTLTSCADSTQVLIQTMNALKPPVEATDSVRFHTQLPDSIDVFSQVDESAFLTHTSSLSTMSSDIINDDLPSNLEFVESYYVDQSTRLKWNSSSSGSLNDYPRADPLLQEDLSVLAGRIKSNSSSLEQSLSSSLSDDQLSSSSSSRNGSQYSRLDSFEQRATMYDSVININEDHFSKESSNINNSDSTSTGTTSSTSTPRRRRSITATIQDTIDHPHQHQHQHQHQPKPQINITTRIVAVDWLLYDGYDWEFTRDTINNAVTRVEIAADEFHLTNNDERNERLTTPDPNEIQTVVGDLLFNSIYIGVPAGGDPAMLRGAINRELNDDMSDTSTITSRSTTPRTNELPSRRKKKLALKRSKRHKMKISLHDVTADIVIFAGVNDPIDSLPGYSKHHRQSINDNGLILNQIDIKINDLEIFDNVHTSTWNKFLSYMRDAGERESNASMVHIQLDTVKPVPYLAVSEIQLKVYILPLRLIVDQDALDFLTRFFEFKDERFIVNETNEDIFIQKLDIKSVSIRLDYKPKKVDYMGLKSGRTIEFMNFFTLDGADIVLRHVVLYGIDGFSKVSDLLNGIWMPDIKQNQLGKFLSGLSSVHSLVKIGSGVRDLFVIPLEEYKKDGRIVRGLQKGAWLFAKNTTNELAKLGAKLAAGTQTILESAEQAMGGTGASPRTRPSYRSPYSDDIESDEEEASNSEKEQQRLTSHYANQPRGVSQGLKSAYQSIGRNLNIAKDAVVDIGVDAAERGNAQGAAIAVMRAAPVVLIRPVIGATEAVSKTLLGVTNQIDPNQLQDVKDKYK